MTAYISLIFRIHMKSHWVASKYIETHCKCAVFIIWPFYEETDGTASWQKSIRPVPPLLKDEDKDNVDPNDYERISMRRDASWCLDRWTHYVKKKYKKCFKTWDTETGLGSCEPERFSDFCGNDRWLVWVYLMDIKSGLRLFSSAKGSTPDHVGMESGFSPPGLDSDDGTSQENNAANCAPSTSKKQQLLRTQALEEVKNANKCHDLSALIARLNVFFKDKPAISHEC